MCKDTFLMEHFCKNLEDSCKNSFTRVGSYPAKKP